MGNICDIVQQAIRTGYLTISAEEQLRRLLRGDCDAKDLSAFTQLQLAAASGKVRQQSREQMCKVP